MDRLVKMKRRLLLYGISLAVLFLLLLVSLWTVIGTGAFLTSENDWQGLAGDYRIGTIDYTVDINGSAYLGQEDRAAKFYELAVPIQGGVRIFDPTLDTTALRDAEFNEGNTLVRVRVVNRSDSMTDMTMELALTDSSGAIRVLPLPLALTEATAGTLNDRQFVLNELNLNSIPNDDIISAAMEPTYLHTLETAYETYYPDGVVNEIPVGLLRGAIPVEEAAGQDVTTEGGNGKTAFFYKDVFLIVWSDYGNGEYNSSTPSPSSGGIPSAATIRQAQFKAKFTVGQLD